MSRLTDHLDAIENWFGALQHEGGPIVTGVHRQLDLVDAEDITTQSFKSPGGFLILPRFRFAHRADGGKDMELWIVLAIACRYSAGTSADADALDRIITAMALIDNHTFGQSQCSDPEDIEARPVLNTAGERKGISVTALTFRQTLFRVVAPPAAAMGLLGATGTGGPRPGNPQTLNPDGPTPDELMVIGTWSPS